MKKVGILGSGAVGVTLANGFKKHGYDVMLGSRSVKKVDGWPEDTTAFADVARSADIVVLAVGGEVARELVASLADDLAGKIVIDTTNPIDHNRQPENGVLPYFTSLDRSLMEDLQTAAKEVKFVKAFNSVGNGLMVNPDFGDQKPTMFICGNDDVAKAEVGEILEVFGWEVADMGQAEAARAIEPLCMLWCILGFNNNEWTHAFKLLRQAK